MAIFIFCLLNQLVSVYLFSSIAARIKGATPFWSLST
jgi:hypothetical protein